MLQFGLTSPASVRAWPWAVATLRDTGSADGTRKLSGELGACGGKGVPFVIPSVVELSEGAMGDFSGERA